MRSTMMGAALLLGCGAMLTPGHGAAQTIAPVTAPTHGFADVADHAVGAATIVAARIRRTRVVEAARAPGLAPGAVRLYVEGDVEAVIFGREALANRIAWLVDLPLDARGRPPRINRQRVLLFARPVVNAGQVQLVNPRAQLPRDPTTEAIARSIASELARGVPPPAITGVAQAFHVPGTIAGEGETQIFLRTETGAPVSLTVLRRPGAARQWAAAFGEIVDEAAGPPAPGTIGHYRLACGLPRTLPAAALRGVEPAHAATAADDYAFVLTRVGACDRRMAR